MKPGKLPGLDLMLSPLTIGCWSFGGDDASYWGEQNQQDIKDVVELALDLGVNCFDTAIIYNNGQSEAALGGALAAVREQVVIIDKIPLHPAEKLSGFEESVTGSLKRLRTGYIDIMMLHWPVRDVDLLRANLEALKKIQEKGMVRFIGTSNFGTGTLRIAKEMGIEVVLNEAAYNLITRALEFEIIPYCLKEHIGIAAYMPLMQGILSGKYKTLEDIPQNRKRTYQFDSAKNPLARHGGRGAEPVLESFLETLRKLAAESGLEPAKLAIAWLRSRSGVATIVAGCRNRKQLEFNAEAIDTVLPSDVMEALDQAGKPLRDELGDNADLWQSGADIRVW